IRVTRLTGCEARIVGMAARAIITVNEASSPGRRRFSIGHELGHWMHDRGTAAFACEETKLSGPWAGLTDREPRANRYAADLLRGQGPEQEADVYADQWLERKGTREYIIREDSTVIAPGVVLSLLWWTNEQPLIEMEEANEIRAARRSDGRDFEKTDLDRP